MAWPPMSSHSVSFPTQINCHCTVAGLRHDGDPVWLEYLEHFAIVTQPLQQRAELISSNRCVRAQQRKVSINLINPVRH